MILPPRPSLLLSVLLALSILASASCSGPADGTCPSLPRDPSCLGRIDGICSLPAMSASCSGGVVCSGHGTLRTWGDTSVCECEAGFSGDPDAPTTCVATSSLCAGGPLIYDWNGDGVPETTFVPTADECTMYELINRTRAGHDAQGSPECHQPLRYSLEWSAHARNHSKQMSDQGGLFHADYPMAQNCAYGCGPTCEMSLYMTGANEGHCPPLSHHCNIMSCDSANVGVGYWPVTSGSWNTQNFYR